MLCCTVRRDIQCCLSGPQLSLDIKGWPKELQAVYIVPYSPKYTISISIEHNCQISYKISDLVPPPAQEIGCCAARRYIYCFWSVSITFLKYIKMIRGALECIYKTLMVHTISCLSKIALNFQVKC